MTAQPLLERFNLRSRLRFDIEKGQIWLDEGRMLMLHAKAFGAMRKELIETLGTAYARRLLFHMGFVAGQQDADLAYTLLGEADVYEVFRIGPELHAFEGLVRTTIDEAEIDWEAGTFFGAVTMANSWEAESHLQNFGVGDQSVCWTLAGYASGYVTRFFRRFIVFKETECTCKGDHKCVMVGKPVEAWGEDAHLEYVHPSQALPEYESVQRELWQLRGQRPPADPAGGIVGNAPAFRTAFTLLQKAARTPITVLLLGETGVGKEVFARWLHDNSDRAQQSFVAVNCAAIPHDLLESELFGVQKGAFTGATQSRPGRFERADGGTLFLDELGEMSPSAQVKLLRVLQTGEIERLGDEKSRKVNVRLVAATNVNLQQAIAEGRFRADLYYRLSTYPVAIPPLRERKSDIPPLVNALLEKYGPIYGKHPRGLTERALQSLMDYDWPGNVRELENIVERAVLLGAEDGQVEIEHLFPGGLVAATSGAPVDVTGQVRNAQEVSREAFYESLIGEGLDLQAHENRILQAAVRRANGNLTQAAKLLGLTRRQLAYRFKQAGLCLDNQ